MKDYTINRRDVMKTAATGVAAGALGVLGGRKVRAAAAASTAKGTCVSMASWTSPVRIWSGAPILEKRFCARRGA